MKFLLLSALTLISTSFAQAENLKMWTCDDGDYHLSLQVAPNAKSFRYKICEFANCDFSDLTRLAVRTSEKKAEVFSISDAQANENIVLSYGSDENLNQVQLLNDHYVVQSFANCKLN